MPGKLVQATPAGLLSLPAGVSWASSGDQCWHKGGDGGTPRWYCSSPTIWHKNCVVRATGPHLQPPEVPALWKEPIFSSVVELGPSPGSFMFDDEPLHGHEEGDEGHGDRAGGSWAWSGQISSFSVFVLRRYPLKTQDLKECA